MKLDDVKKLHQKKYRGQFGHYLVEGEHLILELQKALTFQPKVQTITLYVTAEYQEWANNLDPVFEILVVSQKHMAKLSNTKSPQGLVACVPLPSGATPSSSQSIATSSPKPCAASAADAQGERCIYLHEVQDPGNLGTILRTLAWFGGFRLLLSANSVDPFNPKVVRSSMGAIFHVPIELDVELSELQTRFKKFAYLDMQGRQVNSPEFADYDCYLFGNEARGVPSAALAECNGQAFTIPGNGSIDSLNLASAVNICMYQLFV